MTRHLLAFVSSCLIAGAAIGQSEPAPVPPPPPVETVVTLTNGDIFRGTLVSDGDTVVLNHAVLGQLSFPKAQVASVRTMSAVDAGKSTAAAAEAAAKIPPPPPPPDPDSWLKGWKGSAGLGLNGESGNTESLSLRGGLSFVRETSKTKSTADFVYNYGTTEGDKSKDNGRLDLRNDWLPQGGGKWRPFVQGTVEYDTFQDWDWRVSAYAGLGYELIKTDKMLLLPKFGLGAVKEFGGSDNKIHFEALLGVDFEYKIDDRSKVYATFDSFWSIDEFPGYRLYLKAGYEILVDPTSNLALKLGIEDRYDSSPGPDKNRNDISYFALLVYNF